MSLQSENRASQSSWPLAYARAVRLLSNGEHRNAADILRVLAISVPEQPEIWEALASCHDAENRVDIAQALRLVGRLLQQPSIFA